MGGGPIAQKLSIRPGYRLQFVNEPEGYLSMLGPLPRDTVVLPKERRFLDMIRVFISSKEELEGLLPGLRQSISAGGSIWATYPRKRRRKKGRIDPVTVCECGHAHGLECVAMVPLDGNWAAVRFKREY